MNSLTLWGILDPHINSLNALKKFQKMHLHSFEVTWDFQHLHKVIRPALEKYLEPGTYATEPCTQKIMMNALYVLIGNKARNMGINPKSLTDAQREAIIKELCEESA